MLRAGGLAYPQAQQGVEDLLRCVEVAHVALPRSDPELGVGDESGQVLGVLERDLGVPLMDLLLARFAGGAIPSMGEVARALGRASVNAMATTERPILRAVAAADLARKPDAAGRM